MSQARLFVPSSFRTLGARQECIPDGTPSYHLTTANASRTLVYIQGRFRVTGRPAGMFLEGWRKPENQEEAHVDTRRTCDSTESVVRTQDWTGDPEDRISK